MRKLLVINGRPEQNKYSVELQIKITSKLYIQHFLPWQAVLGSLFLVYDRLYHHDEILCLGPPSWIQTSTLCKEEGNYL